MTSANLSNAMMPALMPPAELNPKKVVVRMAGDHDHPLFHLGDLCALLGVGNVGNVADRLKDDERTYIRRADVGLSAGRDLVYVTEKGFYKVVMRSDKPLAEPLFDWVCGEVLPSIRKHGCYPAPTEGQLVRRAWSERLSKSFKEHFRVVNGRRPGWWSVLIAVQVPVLMMEDELLRHCLPTNESDRPDGSIGLRWSNYRRAELNLPPAQEKASLYLPDQKRSVEVLVYPPGERGAFEAWLFNDYWPANLSQYLNDKFAPVHGKLPPASAADAVCRAVTNRPAQLPQRTRETLDAAGGFIPSSDKRLN